MRTIRYLAAPAFLLATFIFSSSCSKKTQTYSCEVPIGALEIRRTSSTELRHGESLLYNKCIKKKNAVYKENMESILQELALRGDADATKRLSEFYVYETRNKRKADYWRDVYFVISGRKIGSPNSTSSVDCTIDEDLSDLDKKPDTELIKKYIYYNICVDSPAVRVYILEEMRKRHPSDLNVLNDLNTEYTVAIINRSRASEIQALPAFSNIK